MFIDDGYVDISIMNVGLYRLAVVPVMLGGIYVISPVLLTTHPPFPNNTLLIVCVLPDVINDCAN